VRTRRDVCAIDKDLFGAEEGGQFLMDMFGHETAAAPVADENGGLLRCGSLVGGGAQSRLYSIARQ
jgi:hypothetical protein